ncbi:MAG: serine/threonine-protein phosphatase [Gemmatimonadetes bacterium]|nr:serine/threonine-protein phosphatase [Gemmatimonadota bacterium]
MSLEIRAFGRSHVGQVRGRNEDTLAVEPSQGIVVVADGMGGAPAGDLASALAVQEVARALHEGEGMKVALTRANRKILGTAEGQPALSGMGTTITALRVFADEARFVLGHVGDSRAYLLSDGTFSQISRDHTMVRDMVEAGKIPASAEREHPLGHILTRVLGTEESVELDLSEGPVHAGCSFLLCSDGLVKVMEDTEVEGWIRRTRSEPLEALVDAMIEEGNERGAPDNLTVAFLTLEEPGQL